MESDDVFWMMVWVWALLGLDDEFKESKIWDIFENHNLRISERLLRESEREYWENLGEY